MASWWDLADDVLGQITGLLSLPDQHRFSAVCHSWRLVAKQKRRPPVPQLPWLVLGEDHTTKKRNFFSLSEQRLYSIDVPELHGHYICGSSHGWLFTVDSRINGRLLNPLTREFYELPPFPPYDETGIPIAEEEVYDSQGTRIVDSFRQVQKQIVVKALLSHDPKERSDFTALILFGYPCKLVLWRPGDADWTVIKGLKHLSDVICFKGDFFVISERDIVYEVGLNPEIKQIACKTPSSELIGNWRYLVNFKGQLLLIRRYTETRMTPQTSLISQYLI
ncbi:hypothetical protein LUZ60_017690 [Juncus effusus]|nr:hypothetical protein LUZ60_017690 [Juncus effusus]